MQQLPVVNYRCCCSYWTYERSSTCGPVAPSKPYWPRDAACANPTRLPQPHLKSPSKSASNTPFMVDLAASYDRSIEAAGVALASGDRTNAERALRGAIQAAEKLEGSALELAAALIKLGTLKQEMGAVDEAAPLFARALAVSEKELGQDHPDLVILLNDLSRLYLKQSAHELAEPLLLRLLAIKRVKGEDHPEVATVLASLAAVRQALGSHEAAEQLWRRVLTIRERTLAPNHFSLATTLEHLAETCAARGKVREALENLQRALAIRALTLGADHASLRSARERIADLQLQASEESLDHPDATATMSEKPRLQLTDSLRFPLPASAAFEPPVTRPREVPQALERPTPVVRLEEKEASPHGYGLAIRESTPSAPATAPYLNVLMDIKDELEETDEARHAPAAAASLVAALTAYLQPRRTAVMIGAGVIALPLVAWGAYAAMKSDANSGWVQQAPLAQVAPARDSLSSATDPRVAAEHVRDSIAAAVTASAATGRARSEERVSRKASDEPAEPEILVPSMRPMVVRLDSVSRLINSRMGTVGESFSVQMQSTLDNTRRLNAADFEAVGVPQRARLIGALPTPRYPDQLSKNRIGGDVVVRFEVDTDGRPVGATVIVISSPHPLLTAAVRKVIPEMRFDPARSPSPASRPIAESVEIGFKFNPSKP